MRSPGPSKAPGILKILYHFRIDKWNVFLVVPQNSVEKFLSLNNLFFVEM